MKTANFIRTLLSFKIYVIKTYIIAINEHSRLSGFMIYLFYFIVFGKHIKKSSCPSYAIFNSYSSQRNTLLFRNQINWLSIYFSKDLYKIVIFTRYTEMYSYDERRKNHFIMFIYPIKEAHLYFVCHCTSVDLDLFFNPWQ